MPSTPSRMTQHILAERPHPAVTILTLNRPERCNALSGAMLREIHAALDALKEDSRHRVLLFHGNGKGFCSGIDLRECSESDETAATMFRDVAELILKIRRLPGLVLGSVHGGVFGGGAAIAASCDLVVCADETKIGATEIRLGFDPVLLFPLFRRKLAEAPLKELLLGGRAIDAVRAREVGLVQHVVAEDRRDRFTRELLRDVLRCENTATQNAKKMMQANEYTMYGISFEDELRLSLQAHMESWRGDAAREGVRAFLEKRPPAWRQDHFEDF